MVRPMGHTRMVPLHTRTFIAITGNATEISEDMARRTIVTNLNARMEDPERRRFAAGFLDGVFSSRSGLLSDALTIWRWAAAATEAGTASRQFREMGGVVPRSADRPRRPRLR